VTDIDILDVGPADVETLVVHWLMSWGQYRAANTRRAGDPLPFLLITMIPGPENLGESTADPIVQIDILCDKELGEDAARDIKDAVHRRMLLLGRNLEVDGTVDWMKVFESPNRKAYENDKIIRYTARYQFGQTYD
jgi:hypothetical protein